MTPDEFAFSSEMVHARSGFVITRDKSYLLENRLMSVVRHHHLRSVAELIAALRAGGEELATEVVDAMMTKDTGFFRDWKPFVHFDQMVLPRLRVARRERRTFRILCAGVSTGQEACSVAFLIRAQTNAFDGWRPEIVGIDISSKAITAAAGGAYSQFDVQRGLPARFLARDFTKQDGLWLLDDAVRGLVGYKTWNLLDELYPLGRFDVIFCRNVLASFDLRTRLTTLRKFGQLLADDGILYLGRDETTTGMGDGLRCVNESLSLYARADRPMESLGDSI